MVSNPFVLGYDREAVLLGEVLDRQVAVLRDAHRAGEPVAAEVLRGTGAEGTEEELLAGTLTVADARLAIARDHGYADWAAARAQADIIVDTRFEAAADAIQRGELTVLHDLLDAHPSLISMRSRSRTTARCCTTSPQTESRSSGSCSHRRTRLRS